MALKTNDWVVHPQHGVGRVVKSEMREFESAPRQLYYQIALDTGTLWVPVKGPQSGLRKMTPRGDLKQYRRVLRGRPENLPGDHRERQRSLADRVRSGTFLSRCEAVRDLTALSWRKALSEGDAALLRKTRQELCAEWAAVEGLSIHEASREVDTVLLEGKTAHDR